MAKRNSRKSDARFADDMIATVKAAPAVLSTAQLDEVERAFNSWGTTRRTALAFLTKSGGYLIQQVQKDRQFAVALADAANHADEYLEYLRQFETSLKAFRARAIVALACREDMDAVLQEARAGWTA